MRNNVIIAIVKIPASGYACRYFFTQICRTLLKSVSFYNIYNKCISHGLRAACLYGDVCLYAAGIPFGRGKAIRSGTQETGSIWMCRTERTPTIQTSSGWNGSLAQQFKLEQSSTNKGLRRPEYENTQSAVLRDAAV